MSRGDIGFRQVQLGASAGEFSRRFDSPDPACVGEAQGRLLVADGLALFGTTEIMLIHSVILGWYVIMTVVFMRLVEAPAGRERGSG